MTQTVRVNDVDLACQWDDTVPALADKYRVLRYDSFQPQPAAVSGFGLTNTPH